MIASSADTWRLQRRAARAGVVLLNVELHEIAGRLARQPIDRLEWRARERFESHPSIAAPLHPFRLHVELDGYSPRAPR